MIKAVLSNISHPEFGVVSIPLPIPKEQYDSCVELLESLKLGLPPTGTAIWTSFTAHGQCWIVWRALR